MRAENQRMQEFLRQHGIEARVKFTWRGSMKGTWQLYNPDVFWTPGMKDKLTELGFKDFDGRPLNQHSGNGGMFSVSVIGHNEFLEGVSTVGSI